MATLSRVILCTFLLVGCGDSSTNGLSPDPACDRYLSCVKTSMPSAFGAALNSYGKSSACWHTGDAAAQSCSQACTAAVQQLGQSCGCTRDSDCKSTTVLTVGGGERQAQRCDPTSKQCVECLSSSDCAGALDTSLGLHVCDPTGKSCVQCLGNDDCPGKVCSISSTGDTFCGGCSNVTDGCTSPCDVFFYCTLTETFKTGGPWSACLGSDSCCNQTSCGEYAALRACLLQNCGDAKPDPTVTDSLSALTLCAEEKCMDPETACHQNGC